VTFIRNAISAGGVSAIALVAENDSDGDGIIFIASEMYDVLQAGSVSRSSDGSSFDATGVSELPVAVWGTTSAGASLLTFENTWPANALAARYTSLPGDGASEDLYAQFDGYDGAVECSHAAADGATAPVTGPGNGDALQVEFTFTGTRCVTPDTLTLDEIESSLVPGRSGVPELTGRILLQPEKLGQGAVIWHFAADIDGPPGTDGEGPYAVWLKIVQRDGSVAYHSQNDVAAAISSLPRPTRDEAPASSAQDIAHLQRCVQETLARSIVRPTPQAPVIISTVSDCLDPDADTAARISRFLKPGLTGSHAQMVTVSRSIVGTSSFSQVELDRIIMVGMRLDIDPPYGASPPFAVWGIFQNPGQPWIRLTLALNQDAADASRLPLAPIGELFGADPELLNYRSGAFTCAVIADYEDSGTSIATSAEPVDVSQCMAPGDRLQALLEESAELSGVTLESLSMVRVSAFDELFLRSGSGESGIWFVAARAVRPGAGGEEPVVAVWLVSEAGDDVSVEDIQSVSAAADGISAFEGGGAEYLFASFDGFLEAWTCAAAGRTEESAATAEAEASEESSAEPEQAP
jgi:hypothetical protein